MYALRNGRASVHVHVVVNEGEGGLGLSPFFFERERAREKWSTDTIEIWYLIWQAVSLCLTSPSRAFFFFFLFFRFVSRQACFSPFLSFSFLTFFP
jgi:hypothetical protein